MNEEEFNALPRLTPPEEPEMPRRRENRPAPAYRALPSSKEAEMGLLSSLFLSPQYVFGVIERYGGAEGWWHTPAHGTMFAAAVRLYDEGKPIDTLLLMEELSRAKVLEAVGGAAYVSEISMYTPTAANAQHYAEICEAKAQLRQVIKACAECEAEAYEESDEAREIVGRMEQAASSLALRGHKVRSETIKQTVMATVERCQSGNASEIWGLSTGFPNLDAVMRGLRKGAMIAIGGATSSGKTSLAANMIHSACIKHGEPTLVFTLEMDRYEMTEVLLQITSGVNVDNVTRGRVDLLERSRFTEAAGKIASSPLTIRDERDLSIVQARSIARAVKPRLIVIDYAQLLTGGKTKYERGDLEVAEISREAKKMAGELGATVILLTQLNDDGKMAGSRAIGKDADQVLIVKEGANDGEKIVQVCKQRRGPKEELRFRWIGPIQKFIAMQL